jgi:hypothetical protein
MKLGGEMPDDLLWWCRVKDWELYGENVPVFADFGLRPPLTEGRIADADEWMCAREQLWAQREGLA